MIHQYLTDELLDVICDYTLGFLDAQRVAAFEEHLAEGCDVCAQEVRTFQLMTSLFVAPASLKQPPPALRERLLARIQTETKRRPTEGWPFEAEGSFRVADWTIVRSTEGQWEAGETAGLISKRLFTDSVEHRRTVLVRLEAESHYPSYRCADTMELYLIEGDLTVEGHVLQVGDYCAAMAGTVIGNLFSTGGCLFILLTSEQNEMVTEEQRRIPSADLKIVHAAEGSWQPGPAEGMTVKPLFIDPSRGTVTSLIRVEAGHRVPRHRHRTADQTYLLEGDGRMESLMVQAGDYYRAAPGSVHEVSYTEGGCLCLALASINEPLD